MGILTKRFLLLVPAIWIVVSMAFFLLHALPGDPVDFILGENASDTERAALSESLGLNRPVSDQYLHFLGGIANGSWGTSLRNQKPVGQELLRQVGATLQLSATTLLMVLSFGFGLGLAVMLWRKPWFERAFLFVTSIGYSVPSYFLAPLLVYIFSIHWRLFPVTEKSNLASFVLPSITLGLSMSCYLARMVRVQLLEYLSQDFVRTALSKGLSQSEALVKHALRCALPSLLTVVGLQLGGLLTGAIITETIFDWPGVGSYFYQAIQFRDYPAVQGCVVFFAVTYLGTNLLVDVASWLLDPRLRREQT